MSQGNEQSGWLLVAVSTGQAASLRVHVWRHLRKLGAVYLQQSTCLLPDLPEVARTVAKLAARVREEGGSARVLPITLADHADHEAIANEQRAERDAEYAEVLERTPAFLAEIEAEIARGRATYTEVEESEADLQRFERWLAAIAARDYFAAPGAAAAREAVASCRAALARFEELAFAADTTEPVGGRRPLLDRDTE